MGTSRIFVKQEDENWQLIGYIGGETYSLSPRRHEKIEWLSFTIYAARFDGVKKQLIP